MGASVTRPAPPSATRPAPPSGTRRHPVDPDVWATPCALLPVGPLLPDSVAHALDALATARRIADRDGSMPETQRTPHRLKLGDRAPIVLWHDGTSGTRLTIRRIMDAPSRRLPDVVLSIGPRTPSATGLIEPGAGPDASAPRAALARALDAFAVHLDGLLGPDHRILDAAAAAALLARLAGIEAHVRTSRTLPAPTPLREHSHGPVEAATPWSPLRARTLDGFGEPGRDRLTAAERRLWTDPPVLAVETPKPGAERLSVHLDAVVAEAPDDPCPIADMKALRALGTPPPAPRARHEDTRTDAPLEGPSPTSEEKKR